MLLPGLFSCCCTDDRDVRAEHSPVGNVFADGSKKFQRFGGAKVEGSDTLGVLPKSRVNPQFEEPEPEMETMRLPSHDVKPEGPVRPQTPPTPRGDDCCTVDITIRREGLMGFVLEEKAYGLVCVDFSQDGYICQYNRTVAPEMRIYKHDVILSINGATEADAMTRALTADGGGALAVRVHRPTRYRVQISKGSRPLGAEIAFQQQGRSVDVKQIAPNGAIAEHNKSAPPAEVINPGDFIVAVNGITGTPDRLVHAIGNAAVLSLTLMRAPARGA